MKTTRIALACSILLLAACGPEVKTASFDPVPPGTPTTTCSTSQCTVLVTVTSAGGGKCESKVDKPAVKATHNGTVQFEWEIQGEGEFANNPGATDGIAVPSRPQFNGRGPGNKKFKWQYKAHKPPGEESHKYDVFTRLNGVPCDRLDPYIMN